MPKNEYFGGHGSEVMASMRKRYGADAERVFYATANKQEQNPSLKGLGHGRKKRKKRG